MYATGNYMGAQLGRSLAVVGAAGAGGVGLTGFLKDDVDQLVMDLAVQRDMVLLGHYSKVALFDKAGTFMGFRDTITAEQFRDQQKGHPEWTAVGVWGGASLDQIWPAASDAEGNPIAGGSEAVTLARAIDGVLERIKKAETSDQAPSGTPAISQNVIAPLVVAIVVVGLAATVVGSVYVWKKFSPELQRDMAAIRAAADAYQLRVATFTSTGKMPPPGPLEAATSQYVKDSAKGRQTTELLTAAGYAAGAVVGIGVVGWVAKKYWKKAA